MPIVGEEDNVYDVKRIQEAREALVEAEIELRMLQNDYKDAKTELVASTDYYELGPNNDVRDQQLAEIIRSNFTHARRNIRQLEDNVDRLEVELECALDERRHAESVTWAKAVDALRGKVDHIGQAPKRAARELVKGKVEDEAKIATGIDIDEDTGEITDDEIPF